MTFSKNLLQILVAAILFIGFAGYSFSRADVWTPPTANPPLNNVDVPINTGSSSQIKTGSIGVNTLSITEGILGISSVRPKIKFISTNIDTPADPWWLFTESNLVSHKPTMSFAYDRDGNGTYGNDYPIPLVLQAGENDGDDYARFANQVRAVQYCDEAGDNCVDGSDLGGTLPPQPRTYTTTSNNRSVSGASCSCYDGDYITSCEGSGNIHASDQNACSSGSGCTCLTTKQMCTVNFTSKITNWPDGSLEVGPNVLSLSLPKGSPFYLGYIVTCTQYEPEGGFTNVLIKKGYNASRWNSDGGYQKIGYWTPADYLSAYSGFKGYQWHGSTKFTATDGSKTFSSWNGCLKTIAKTQINITCS